MALPSTRAWALLAPLAAVALALGLVVAPASADPVPDVDALRARAERASAELERSTEAWREGRRALELARKRLAGVRERAGAARADAEAARVELGAYAAAAYKGGALPDELDVLLSEQDDPADALHALATAEVAGRGKSAIVRTTQRLTQQAEQLEAEARGLAEAAEADDARLSADLERIKATAARTAAELEEALAEVARIEAERRAEAQRRAAERAARTAQRATVPSGGGGGGACSSNATAGYPNGLIPASALCSIGGGALLRADAARGFKAMDAAYRSAFGSSICVSGGYRDLATQQRLFAQKPGLAAVPGTSNHGWGLAVDLCGGIESFSSARHRWMRANAGRFGWKHPSWARQGGGREEPWHWEYGT